MRRASPLVMLGGVLLIVACGNAPDSASGDAAATRDDNVATPATPATASGGGGSGALRDSTRVTIDATIGGRDIDAAGWGECHHTTNASIYDVPAAQWRASFPAGSGDLDHLNLTVWEPKAGGPSQVTLSIDAGGRSHAITTVTGGMQAGRGTATARRNGAAGVLTVEGEDSTGTALRVTVQCDRLTEPVAEGG